MSTAVRIVPHEEHADIVAQVEFNRATYDGGEDYKHATDERGAPVLPQYEHETPAGYKARRSGTAVINIAGDLVPKRIGEIFGQPIVREPLMGDTADAVARAWAEDVDREGTPIGEWMERRAHDVLVDGVIYIGIDSEPASNTGGALTRADVQRNPKLRPYAVWADARNVVDWESERGQLTRIVIEHVKRVKSDATSKPVESRHWIEWTATEWRRYEADKDGNVVRAGGTTHEFGRVPWRAVSPLKRGYVGRIAGLQKAVLGTMSRLEAEEVACVFTQLYFTGVSGEAIAGAKPGPGEAMVLPSPEAKIDTVSGDPNVITSLLAVLSLKLAELYRRAESADKTASSQQPRSGVAEAYVFKGLEALLQTIARELQAAENWLIETWAIAAGLGEESAKSLAKSAYPTEFDVLSDEAVFARYEWILTNRSLPIEVRRHVLSALFARLFPVDDSRREAAMQSIETWTPSAGEAFLAGGDAGPSRSGAFPAAVDPLGGGPLLAGMRG